MQKNQGEATSTDEVKQENKKITIPGGAELFHTRADRPWGPTSLL